MTSKKNLKLVETPSAIEDPTQYHALSLAELKAEWHVVRDENRGWQQFCEVLSELESVYHYSPDARVRDDAAKLMQEMLHAIHNDCGD